jgi:hypothetical protein
MISLIYMIRTSPSFILMFRVIKYYNFKAKCPSFPICSPVNRIQLILKGKNVLQKKRNGHDDAKS